jgi:hypothetical protein
VVKTLTLSLDAREPWGASREGRIVATQFLSQTTEGSGPFSPVDDFAQTNAIGPGKEIDQRPRLDAELFSQFFRDCG